ncbi:mechanosensitive ion channel family protein [Desulfobacter postgatei]|uniref:Small-conductance mechanosensitive channel n=1 Tax=Desulfobacter postgatei 2ac9 TaxID=879212 RepID=I5B7E1_9BACT|nr:mechanosensitive ion channel domain-containing protein [Desulfobacter postgatei]EIM65404.1 small-conductance mechanosensitive channel [Desulfobacter postgatei 2ac9]
MEWLKQINIEKYIETLTYWVTTYSVKIIAALLILVIGKWLARRITNLITKLMEKNKIDITLVRFFDSILYYTFMVMIVIAAAGQLGINTTSFLTIVGAAGLAIGLALKDSLGNFASGVMLVLFRPYKVNDFVDIGGVAGNVVSISLFTTELSTGDNQKVIVPNASITSNVITNVTANPTRRVDLVIGIGYDDDIKKAKEVIQGVLAEEKRILPTPAPLIAVSELADSSVNFVVRPWVKTGDYWGVYFALHENIKLALDANGISIPFPQHDVHMYRESKE